MTLVRSTKNKITKDKNGENEPYLEINEIGLVHFIMFTMIISMIEESCIYLFQSKLFGQLLYILQKKPIFLKTFNPEF